jgi:hypothetical protein
MPTRKHDIRNRIEARKLNRSKLNKSAQIEDDCN